MAPKTPKTTKAKAAEAHGYEFGGPYVPDKLILMLY